MKEFVVHTYCDRSDVHPDTQEPGEEVTMLNSKLRPVVLDLCETCEKGITLTESRTLADAIGQPAELPNQRGRKPKPAPGPCPDCGAEFETSQGLAMHRNRAHGVKGKGKNAR